MTDAEHPDPAPADTPDSGRATTPPSGAVPEADQTIVAVSLPGCPDCDSPGQQLLARATRADCYRILEVPDDSALLGVGDLVIALPIDGQLEFVAVVERCCVASFSFRLPGWVERQRFMSDLERTGAHHNEVEPRFFMCNVSSEASVHALCDLLVAHRIRARYCDHRMMCWHEV